MDLLFMNEWCWLIFVIIGLILIIMELVVGVETGLDLVFIGSAFLVGGLITWPFHNWIVTTVVTSIICIAYVFLGRTKVKRWITGKKENTNIDVLIGMKCVVTEAIPANGYGAVKVRGDVWRATSDKDLSVGSEAKVESLSGVTLTVK